MVENRRSRVEPGVRSPTSEWLVLANVLSRYLPTPPSRRHSQSPSPSFSRLCHLLYYCHLKHHETWAMSMSHQCWLSPGDLFIYFFPRVWGGGRKQVPWKQYHVVNCSLTDLCQLVLGQKESSLIFRVFWKEAGQGLQQGEFQSMTLGGRLGTSSYRKFSQILDSCFPCPCRWHAFAPPPKLKLGCYVTSGGFFF